MIAPTSRDTIVALADDLLTQASLGISSVTPWIRSGDAADAAGPQCVLWRHLCLPFRLASDPVPPLRRGHLNQVLASLLQLIRVIKAAVNKAVDQPRATKVGSIF